MRYLLGLAVACALVGSAVLGYRVGHRDGEFDREFREMNADMGEGQ